MPWIVTNHDDFDPEYAAMPQNVQDALIARADARFAAHLEGLKGT